jgi:hypothetical protein
MISDDHGREDYTITVECGAIPEVVASSTGEVVQ